jgi:CRISPR-associated protein Csc1
MSATTPAAEGIHGYTYDATLYTPLFYASKEGSVVETDPIVAATALMHAIGYEYYDLKRAFALAGDAATTADYSHLLDLPFFTSEMTPSGDYNVNERTFRTVSYTTERAVVSSDTDVGQFLTGAKNPIPRSFEGSNAGWHKMREYIGLPPGTEFTFTIWAPESAAPPDELGFRAGIKRSGELRATQREEPTDTVTVNQYLLQTVYDIGDDAVYNIMDHAVDYKRGNDMRTNRFVDVDADWFTESILPELIDT